MSSGIVKWFNKTKGYGFILPDDGGEDVFVHVTVLEKTGTRYLEEGQPLHFETEIKNGRLRAISIELIDGPFVDQDGDDQASDLEYHHTEEAA
jgi:cold-shock DNA-binding protein family